MKKKFCCINSSKPIELSIMTTTTLNIGINARERAHHRACEEDQNVYDEINGNQKGCDYGLSERIIINVSGLRFETQLKTNGLFNLFNYSTFQLFYSFSKSINLTRRNLSCIIQIILYECLNLKYVKSKNFWFDHFEHQKLIINFKLP
ncbi:hypothetical protein BpHYR1_047556 [Brachionus plicatilis]|uniref:Uncharacterized protein n=1 Tax=Brachionus plicatilis TaxID=10195 RepID=A0A3M7SRW4_BRAPC|nr:hypothetical protein BpHYR1_047556 [Brachionus plicatilis]